MDRRQTKTRKAVFEAFVELLEEKGYSNITIQDIIDRANIGRSTFYSHFQTKDDLLNVLCSGIFDHAFGEHAGKEQTHDFSGRSDLKAELTHTLYHLRDSSGYVKGILSSESGDVFMRYFREHLRNVFEKEITVSPAGIPLEYAVDRCVWDFSETVRWWMDHDSYPPEDVMEFFWHYMHRVAGRRGTQKKDGTGIARPFSP